MSGLQLLSDTKDIAEPELRDLLSEEEIINATTEDLDILGEINNRSGEIIDDSELITACDSDEDMDTKLNPDAKEFVPTSPQRTSVNSPFSNGGPFRPDLFGDDPLLAQSPRKGNTQPMDDIELPIENDFSEISQRPSELAGSLSGYQNGVSTPNGDGLDRPGSSNSQCSYQEMNLKEAMHADEKLELGEEISDPCEAADSESISVEHPVDFHISGNISESDPMNMSFYGKDADPFNPDMNAVQQLPDDEDDNELVAFDGKFKPDVGLLVDNNFMGENEKSDVAVRENGAQFHIEDTEFGMEQQNDAISKSIEAILTPNESENSYEAVSQGIIGLQINTNETHQEVHSSLLPTDLAIDQPLQPTEHQRTGVYDNILNVEEDAHEPASISDVVHELATQVTSVLNSQFSDGERDTSPIPPASQTNILSEHLQYVESADLAQQFQDEERQVNVIKNEDLPAMPCDDQQLVNADVEPFHVEQHDLTSEIVFPVKEEAPLPVFESVFEQKLVEPSALVDEPIAPAVIEPVVASQPEQDNNVGILAAAGVVTATAVAAAAATVAAKTTAPKAKPDAKKPEVKARTSTASSTLTARKPLAAPLKSTRPASSTAAKSVASPTKTAATKSATLTASRTARLAPTKAAIDKKPLASATTAGRKPLSNGTSTTTVRKTTATTTTAARPLASTTKTAATRTTLTSSAGSKTTTTTSSARTSTLSARPASSTLPKVATTAR